MNEELKIKLALLEMLLKKSESSKDLLSDVMDLKSYYLFELKKRENETSELLEYGLMP